MKITFKKIKIENFKNISEMSFDFGQKTNIYGANETGKTTIADAISWVLTGKNSMGESQFYFSPIGYPNVSSCVSLMICIDNGKAKNNYELQRSYIAQKNRVKEFTGDYKTECSINRLKCGPRDFEKWIEEHICNPEIFRLIHDVRYFTENIATKSKERPWEAQRRLLFSLVNVKTDADYARSKKKYFDISDELSKFDNAAQYFSVLKQKEKQFESEIAQINLVQKIESDETGEYSCLTEKQIDDEIKRMSLELEKLNKQDEEEYQQKTNNGKKIVEQLSEELAKLDAQYREEQEKYLFECRELDKKISEKQKILLDEQTNISVWKSTLEKLKKELKEQTTVCPNCGQNIPNHVLEHRNHTIQEGIERLQARIEISNKKIEDVNVSIADLEEQYKKIKKPLQPKEIVELRTKLLELSKSPDFSFIESDNLQNASQKRSIEYSIEKLQKAKGKVVKVAQLNAKKKELLDKRANNRKFMDLCNDLISEKAKVSVKKINDMLNGIQFEMFSNNKTNEEVRECCNIFWNGVPYESLSYSTKFIVSMNIAIAFQKVYNVTFPLIVDNAESIDFGIDIPVQSIMLIKRDEKCPICGLEAGRKEPDGLWTCKSCGNRFKKNIAVETL